MWPDYFPDRCPPRDARQDELEVFRLVSGALPSADDFLPSIVATPHRNFPPDTACIACGVSVFKKLEDILARQQRYKGLRSKAVAKGTITSADGVVLETLQPSHVTWWLQTDQPHATFTLVTSDV